MQFLRGPSLRSAFGATAQQKSLGGFSWTSNVSTNHPRLWTTGKVSLSSLKPASITKKNKSSNNTSIVLSRNFHAPLVRRTNERGIVGSHNNKNITNKPLTKFPLAPLLHSQMGSISHFSGMFGGGAKRPGGGGGRVAQGVGLLGAGSVLLGKTKYLLAALKLTKLASLGSMLVTVGTYSMFFGWPYALGMVGLITVHECGHALVMHQRGIPFSPMVFVPFMGAAVVMNRGPRDAWEDAVVGYGGPALGSLGAGAVAIGAHMTDSQLLYALADFGFMINLFNLLPIGMMDGGRITGAISPYLGVAGLGLGGMMAYSGQIHNPIFYLILLSGGYETFMRFYDPTRLPPNYYRITPWQRGTVTVAYVGLVGALLAAMDANQKYKKPPEVLMREQSEKSWDMR
mmetsp:Transcript_2828/g.5512  ORF Transcript_2828/g.5512 Transcript_2828/m.5512 type:complete len:400 (-) Transcript_2828:96-1295(-)